VDQTLRRRHPGPVKRKTHLSNYLDLSWLKSTLPYTNGNFANPVQTQTISSIRVACELGPQDAALEQDIIKFLRRFGYKVTTPKIVRGSSGADQEYDISAVKDGREILFDISSRSETGADRVVAFYAKNFDTRPKRPILICVPGVNRDARNLIAMYKIETVIAEDSRQVLQKLSEALTSGQ